MGKLRVSIRSVRVVLTTVGVLSLCIVACLLRSTHLELTENMSQQLVQPFDVTVRGNGHVSSKLSCQIDKDILEGFKPQISIEEKALLKDLLSTFQEVLMANSLEFFLVGGSLLGSYRHHGMIPWDDDIDIMVNADLKPSLRKAMNILGPTHGLYTSGKTWKFYLNSTKPLINLNWPFLDIFFFTMNSSHITHNYYGDIRHFHKSIIYPLAMRPFMGLWIPAPKNTEAYLATAKYNVNMCELIDYTHKLKKGRGQMDEERDHLGYVRSIPCEFLADVYPFVKRETMSSFVKETLFARGKIIHVKFVSIV